MVTSSRTSEGQNRAHNKRTPAACEMERLPEELLMRVVSLTSPPDACRAAAVSRAFRAAADSDAVWSMFLPRNLPRFAKGELPRTPPSSKKELFRRLSDQPALLPHKLMSMQLDRATGAQRFTLSARALQNRAPVASLSNCSKGNKRFFSEAAQFYRVNELEIRAKVQRKMLSQNTTYAVYLVFKLEYVYYEFGFPYEVASVGVAGRESTRLVSVQGNIKDGDGDGNAPHRHIFQGCRGTLSCDAITSGEDIHFPRENADGWMEVELGEFHNDEADDDGEVSISFTGESKSCLKVLGIELISKQQKPT
ncbi:F-box protein PP2-B11-like [Triticum dicoccoides]|uniref:F-box protein PP2-B11-like n=1 Tax=Triticum dicoccoides TaxID=85692 RepID=UPI0018913D02|nr:F-box protein PP2-B11-like [Triticum dicoccoides]